MSKHEDKRPAAFRTVIILVIVFVVAGIAAIRYANRQPDSGVDAKTVAALAECLTQKGVKMYGTYWCPHCQAQKKLFGDSFSKIDYVECSPPNNPREQTQPCKDAGIISYPTWVFPDGGRVSGEVSFKDLADKSGCPFSRTTVAPAPGVTIEQTGQPPLEVNPNQAPGEQAPK